MGPRLASPTAASTIPEFIVYAKADPTPLSGSMENFPSKLSLWAGTHRGSGRATATLTQAAYSKLCDGRAYLRVISWMTRRRHLD
jgi:hypothetical protein